MSQDYLIGTQIPLTAEGQRFASHKSEQEKFCLLPDYTLLVSRAYARHADVLAFEARLKRLRIQYQIELVDYKTISAAYGVTALSSNVTSTMQEYAKRMFTDATKMHASDIHIRVDNVHTEIIFGIRNDMVPQRTESVEFGKQLLTAIYCAMTDVADATYESLSGQDARIGARGKLPSGVDGIRIATSQQLNGTVMVLRLLYNDAGASDALETLGFSAQHAKGFEIIKKIPTGINFITGPTGAGKSTTLQRSLRSLLRSYRYRPNLITVEDPVEYTIEGAVQTPVTEADTEESRSAAFEDAIRRAMRMAPNIIMIGEVRDKPSAMLAIRAAMTGHQVWTTLHTIGAFPTFARLLDLGIPADLLYDADIVTSITSQKLLKILCPSCKKRLDQPNAEFVKEDIERIRLHVPDSPIFVLGDGCDKCQHTGNVGRTVVAESLITTRELMHILRTSGRDAGEEYWLKEMKGITMMSHAIEKICMGEVDPFEAERSVFKLRSGRAA